MIKVHDKNNITSKSIQNARDLANTEIRLGLEAKFFASSSGPHILEQLPTITQGNTNHKCVQL
jgi:hypothetical protein